MATAIDRPRTAKEYYEPLVRKMLRWWHRGSHHPAIAERLNAEGVMNFDGRPWKPFLVSRIIKRYGDDPAGHAARVQEAQASGSQTQARARAAYYQPLLPKLQRWWDAELSFRAIAERLNEQGIANFEGRPWIASQVRVVLRRYVDDGASYAARTRKALGRGPKARARARDRYNRPLVPKLRAWFDQGISHESIAERLNAEGVMNSDGRPWSKHHVSVVLKRYDDRDPAATIREARRRGVKAQARACDAHCRPLVPTMVGWRRQGLSPAAIAERLNEQGIANSAGRRWTRFRVDRVLKRYGGRSIRRGPAGRPKQDVLPVLCLGGENDPIIVLGVEKPPFQGKRKVAFRVIKAVLELAPFEPTWPEIESRARCEDARGIAKRIVEGDRQWSQVFHFPGRGGRGVRIGRPLNKI
jgi:hypothetical protein